MSPDLSPILEAATKAGESTKFLRSIKTDNPALALLLRDIAADADKVTERLVKLCEEMTAKT